MTDPAKIISIMKVMLSELERSLSTAPQPANENAGTDAMKDRIDRLEVTLKKREDANRRKRELDRENRKNSSTR